jgi:hypothetical protein
MKKLNFKKSKKKKHKNVNYNDLCKKDNKKYYKI